MFWNKKEDKKLLPDLPPIRSPILMGDQDINSQQNNLDDDLGEEYGEERHELPSFPDSLTDKGFSQAAIKDAVSSDNEEEVIPGTMTIPSASAAANKFQTIEMGEWTPSMKKEDSSTQDVNIVMESNALDNRKAFKNNRRLEEPPLMEERYSSERMQMRQRTNSDIFVKLDKFYSARKSLVDAQQKLEEVDALLRKIREIKIREEQELSSWEKELMGIKSRINDIAINLFEKGE